jgi:cephalosporin hydroxylase
VSQTLTLGTYQGIPCHHWDEELPLIANVLQTYTPRIVVEVGAMYGGFAAFLADMVAPWRGHVYTYDRISYAGVEAVAASRANLTFVNQDVFESPAQECIESALAGECSLLYCDAGSKRLELTRFGHYADLVGVHDYGTEITPEACALWAEVCLMVPVQEEAFASLQAAKGGYFVSRFWRRGT